MPELSEVSDVKAATNRLLAWHSGISGAMTAERTSLESKLIPVSAYIVVAAVECWYRHPEMMRVIDAAMPAEAIGAAGRRPGCRVNAVHLWSIANIYLTGRKVLSAFQLADDRPEPTWTVLDFWERAALGCRGDGHRQAWDAGFHLTPYGDDVIAQLMDGVEPVTSDDDRSRIKRLRGVRRPQFRLRVGEVRVFYDVSAETVEVLAIVAKSEAEAWLVKQVPTTRTR